MMEIVEFANESEIGWCCKYRGLIFWEPDRRLESIQQKVRSWTFGKVPELYYPIGYSLFANLEPFIDEAYCD